MGTTADKLNHLLETKDKIKAALISRGQSVSDDTTFFEYADKIRAIKIGVDTSDATATADDILSGKTAYVNGQKVTGWIPFYSEDDESVVFGNYFTRVSEVTKNSQNMLRVTTQNGYDTLAIGDLADIIVDVPLSEFGNVPASKVASGYTFTSSAGVKAVGTWDPLPVLSTARIDVYNLKQSDNLTVYYTNCYNQLVSTSIYDDDMDSLDVCVNGIVLIKGNATMATISKVTAGYSYRSGTALIVTKGGIVEVQ